MLSVLLVPVGVALMWHFSQRIRAERQCVARRTLLLRHVPRSQVRKERLLAFFAEHLPDVVVDGVQLVYNTKQLRALYAEHCNMVNAVAYCQEYLQQFGERCEVRPYFLGLMGGLCCCCTCCGKRDGLSHYQEQAQRTERDLTQQFVQTISAPVGAAFVTFRSEAMAQAVVKWLRRRQRQDRCACLSGRPQEALAPERWLVSYAPDPEDVLWWVPG